MEDTTVSFDEWLAHVRAVQANPNAHPPGNFDEQIAFSIRDCFQAFAVGPAGLYRGLPFAVHSNKVETVDDIVDYMSKTIGHKILYMCQVPKAGPMLLRFAVVPIVSITLK